MATSTSGVNLAMSGLASGMDWQSLVTALANAERAPETQWKQSQSQINNRNATFTTIKSNLSTLQTAIQALQDSSLYTSRTVQSSNSAVATATADAGANLGSFVFNVTQLATAAQLQGSANVSQVLSPDGNLSNVTLGTAGFSSPITAGVFSVNGKQISVATTDSLQQVFDQIATATNGAVTASYNSSTDKITLTSTTPGQEVVLGSATDTSNFLQVAQLFNNGTGTITSASALGSVRLDAPMSSSDLATALSDGGSGQGEFTINGVSITYDASNDSIQNVLDRINNSAAGVTASFDSQNDRFLLTNKTTGDIGFGLQDVTGNFLAATGLAGGTLSHGKNLQYTVNGGAQLVSQSNNITSDTSGLTGLTVTALQLGPATVTVGSDINKITSAIQTFVKSYNSVQSYISSQMTVNTGSDSTVTAGLLTGDSEANGIASSLRSLAFSFGSSPGGISSLADLGIQTNGQDNTLTLSDTAGLNSALTNNLNAVQAFFTDATSGWATPFNTYLDNTIGDSGTLTSHQASLTSQSTAIDTQIANLEKTITADTKRWTSEFQQMEQVQASINQQLQYLTQQINNGTL